MSLEPWRDRCLVFRAPSTGTEGHAVLIACLDSGWVGSGPRVAELEEQFPAYEDVADVVRALRLLLS